MNKNEPILRLRDVTVLANKKIIFCPLSFDVNSNTIHSIMGPSGIGKSTLLKCINRLTDLQPTLIVQGEILYKDCLILKNTKGNGSRLIQLSVEQIRQSIGMVFQAPVIFPGSIEKNVLFGVRHLMPEKKKDFPAILEMSLKEAALWDEVKDRLNEKAEVLSLGQKQRLSIARVLALRPNVILLDEPTSSLDSRSTELIEELFLKLKEHHTLVLVTHDGAQAERISDTIVHMCWENGVGCLKENQDKLSSDKLISSIESLL